MPVSPFLSWILGHRFSQPYGDESETPGWTSSLGQLGPWADVPVDLSSYWMLPTSSEVLAAYGYRKPGEESSTALAGKTGASGAGSVVQVDQAAVSAVNPGVAQWGPLVSQVASEIGVPAEVMLALMDIESDGNPKARSVAGAMGLMQVMPFHFQPGEDPFDPETNVRKAAQILKRNFDAIKAKDPSLSDAEAWELAAVAYFGAFDWGTLSVTGAQDAYGTSGYRYVQLFRDLKGKYAAAVSYAQGPAGTPISGPLGSGLIPSSAVTGGKTYPVTQEFGRTEFARTSGMYRSGSHPGYDIGVPMNTPITAPIEGVVVQAGWNGGYGNSVTIRLGDWRYILVGHLSRVTVGVNQKVTPGTVLGYSGSTGASTGPHVHLELRDPNGVPIDPTVLFTF